jgi:hypothetical protein
MGQDQRDAVSLPCPFVYEVNVDGAEFSAKVLERVQLALLRPPVEAVGPVASCPRKTVNANKNGMFSENHTV